MANCPNCAKAEFEFDQLDEFKEHYFACYKEERYQKRKRQRDKLKSRPDYKGKPKRHQCADCGKTFEIARGLEDHMNAHLGIKPHK